MQSVQPRLCVGRVRGRAPTRTSKNRMQREVLKVERGLGVGSGAGSLHLGTGREPILHAARGDGGPSAHGNRPQVDLTQRSLHWQLRCAEQVDNNAQKQM